jgi:hypothetical protein
MVPNVSTSTPSTGIEFSEDDPLLVDVGFIDGKWDIAPSSTKEFRDGKLYSKKMQERLDFIGRDNLSGEWGGRRKLGARAQPEFVADPTHNPIVVRPGEHVCFQCEYSFTIGADRDGNVSPKGSNSPDNPFEWQGGPQSTQTKAPFSVIGVAKGNLYEQRFYKTEASFVANGESINIDPDCIGSTDGGS